jgi:hypothetical protein
MGGRRWSSGAGRGAGRGDVPQTPPADAFNPPTGPANPNGGASSQGGGHGGCFRCGQVGHQKRDCPQGGGGHQGGYQGHGGYQGQGRRGYPSFGRGQHRGHAGGEGFAGDQGANSHDSPAPSTTPTAPPPQLAQLLNPEHFRPPDGQNIYQIAIGSVGIDVKWECCPWCGKERRARLKAEQKLITAEAAKKKLKERLGQLNDKYRRKIIEALGYQEDFSMLQDVGVRRERANYERLVGNLRPVLEAAKQSNVIRLARLSIAVEQVTNGIARMLAEEEEAAIEMAMLQDQLDLADKIEAELQAESDADFESDSELDSESDSDSDSDSDAMSVSIGIRDHEKEKKGQEDEDL